MAVENQQSDRGQWEGWAKSGVEVASAEGDRAKKESNTEAVMQVVARTHAGSWRTA